MNCQVPRCGANDYGAPHCREICLRVPAAAREEFAAGGCLLAQQGKLLMVAADMPKSEYREVTNG